MYLVAGMAGEALPGHVVERTQRPGQVPVHRRFLGGARKAAGGVVHGRADPGHVFGHVPGHVAGAVPLQGGHAQPVLGDIRRAFVLAGGQRGLDFGDGRQVVAHVAQHVGSHHGGQFHVFAPIVRLGRQRGQQQAGQQNRLDEGFRIFAHARSSLLGQA